MSFWQHIEQQIEQQTYAPFHIQGQHGIGGGSINTACRIGDGEREFFIKTNHSRHAHMFEAEAEGLGELASSDTIKVPEPICYGLYEQQCYIVMEYLSLGGRVDTALLGQQLVNMHRVTQAQFGWTIDNTIGSTPQVNTPTDDWIEFWRNYRLGSKLELAARNGYAGELQRLGERLMADFPCLFDSHKPEASMLHGDLWSGNYGGLPDGTPVIFDPAFYYGDREADLAMTTLFGGFGASFYAAYNEAWPLDDGYAVRKTFYNAYHIINHLNMFGGGYHGQAINMLEQVLAEISS